MVLRLTDSAGLRAARAIATRMRGAGHQAFFAGGCVRDLLLGKVAKDFDVATSATPDEIIALFPRTLQVGAHFGVILVLEAIGEQEIATEVATFRHDGAYLDGRRPDAVRFTADPREDVLRRDFTINGMLLDPWAIVDGPEVDESAVLDFIGGREDLSARLVRTIGPAELRFAEDKLRMLRGVRFAARLGFAIEAQTLNAMRNHAAEIAQVSAERVRDELTRMLTQGNTRRAFELLDESGLLAQVLPEIVRMHGVEQPPEYHPEGDVFVHTMMLLEQLAAGAPATLGWGMLLHDVGKPATFQPPNPLKPGDRIRFNGHVEAGVRIAEEILRRLRFSGEDSAQIIALVKHHMQFGDVKLMKQSTLKRFLRLSKFEEHLALHRADCLSSHGDLRLHEFAKAAYETTEPEQVRPALLVTGKDLIAAGYKPGPRFKKMLEAAEDAQLEGRIRSNEEGMQLVEREFGAVMSGEQDCDVVVIGAGMAGLAAARVIAEAGRRVIVLEAQDRVGGRIRTIRDGDTVIELGAEFVHGRPPELWDLIAEAGLETYERTGDFLLRSDNGLVAMDDEDGEGDPLEKLKEFAGPDCSFAEYLDRFGLDEDARRQELGFVEGFNAADAGEASAMALERQQVAEDAIEGDRSWRISEGYERLPAFLHKKVEAAGGCIVTEAAVATVRWKARGGAEVSCVDGRVWRADKVVVTVPLGVLQAGILRFEPEVPGIAEAAKRLRMGHVCRFTVLFNRRLWPEGMSFLMTPELLPRVWWTARPAETHSLSGWVGGPSALALLQLSAEALEHHAVTALAATLEVREDSVRAALIGFHTHDWDADEWTRGAYTWVPVGGLEGSAAMCEPVEQTLYFAGEHTDTSGHWGTVHAALRSGLRAGRQVVEALRG